MHLQKSAKMNKRIPPDNNPLGLSVRAKILFVLLTILISISCKRNNEGEYTVISGPFRKSVVEAGELEAIKASFIAMPQIDWRYGYQFKIIGLTEHGRAVHKNDSVIKLDASSVYKFILEKEDVLENELAASKKQEVQSENNVQELTAQLKSEQSAWDLKKLEVDRSKFDTDVKKKIKELEFQQATVKLNKVKRNFNLKPKLDEYDRQIQKIKVLQCQADLDAAKETLKNFLIRAPLDGIFQVAADRWSENQNNWKIGDSPYQGQIIASIPDINWMRAKTYINEADINKIRKGMKVIVRLDALPSVPFNGVITDISRICLERDKEKVFNVIVEIAESDLRLKPGMTVNCEYILYDSEKEIFVPNSCILKEMGHTYIFLEKGKSVRKIEVSTGMANSNHTVVKGDIKPGQKLVPVSKILNTTNI
jgi:HlyD family secretion protein